LKAQASQNDTSSCTSSVVPLQDRLYLISMTFLHMLVQAT